MLPLTRIVVVIALSTAALLWQQPLPLFAILSFCLVLLVLKKSSAHERKRLAVFLLRMLPALAGIFVVQALFNHKGNRIVLWGLSLFTDEGLNTAATVMLRLLILLCSGAWLWGLTPRQFNSAFRTAGLPETISVTLMLTLRWLPLLAAKIRHTLRQLEARGIRMRKLSPSKRLKTYQDLLIPILGWTMKDMKFQAAALDLRGFRNGGKHTHYGRRKLFWLDWLVIALAAGFLLLLRILF